MGCPPLYLKGGGQHSLKIERSDTLPEMYLSCEQMGVKMHKLGERCDLFQEGGRATDPAIDKRMDFHFNAILDVVSEWRKDKSQNQDTPLGGHYYIINMMIDYNSLSNTGMKS